MADVISIREYTPNDAETLLSLFKSSVWHVARRDYTQEQVQAWAPDDMDLAVFAARREAKHTWIARIGDAVAGFTDLEPDGHIDMFYVHAEHQNKGAARALLDHVERQARVQGITRLYSEVSITAKHVFVRHGFTVIAAQTVARNGQTFTNYRMEKPL